MPQYTHTTRLQARTALALRLQDPGYAHWDAAELDLYIAEALHLYQALTASYRERATPFNTVASQGFYDLRTLLPAQLGCSTLDQNLVSLIQYHLLEPATGNSWVGGTDQFDLTQVSNAIQKRRDRFLVETGIVHTYAIIPSPPAPVSRVPLPANSIDVHEWYPHPTNARTYNAIYQRRGTNLSATVDLPYSFKSDTLMHLAVIQGCDWALANIANKPELANTNWIMMKESKKKDFRDALVQAIKQDDEISPLTPFQQGSQYDLPLGGEFVQSHDMSSILGGI